MIRDTVKVIKETKTYYRPILSCGHKASSVLANKDSIRDSYFCHACDDQNYRAKYGSKPNLKRRKNSGQPNLP